MRIYTKKQWDWLWQRYCEGYSLGMLGAFLGLHPETIRRRFQKLGYLPESRKDLVPIRQRYGEFCTLEDDRCA